MKDWQKEFCTVFSEFSGRYSNWQVWNDFLTLSAILIAASVPYHDQKRSERTYRTTMNRYDKSEQHIFNELFECIIMALEDNPEQDYLGGLYEKLKLSQHQKGQFFTPYYVCKLMAEIQFASNNYDSDMNQKGYISVNDPACGAGAMLIAIANKARNHEINYQQKVLFVAQDIDYTASMMCYVQLSLLGCPAIVIVGDSLARPGLHPDNQVWYTPFYYLNAWRFRDRSERKPEKLEGKKTEGFLEEVSGQLNFLKKIS